MPCPGCGTPFVYPEGLARLCRGPDGVVDRRCIEDWRGLGLDAALRDDRRRGRDGENRPVRARDVDDERWHNAGRRGWLAHEEDNLELEEP